MVSCAAATRSTSTDLTFFVSYPEKVGARGLSLAFHDSPRSSLRTEPKAKYSTCRSALHLCLSAGY
jgi:hypothetical protein